MKHQKPKHPKHQESAPISKKKRPWAVLIAVIVGAVAGILFWQNRDTSGAQSSTAAPASIPAHTEKDQLVGRWVRTDSNGAYTLEIRSASDDGKLDASYFNPNPINVGRAEWHRKEGSITVVVELRDVNYPGSIYTLSFSKTNDQLVGTYYQAVEGVNYDVAFARTR
jgi:hypothetical protein